MQRLRIMETPERFVAELLTISDEALVAALLWHVAAVVVVVALAFGWRPRARTACLGLAVHIASVSAVAIALHSVFWGVSFGLLALALAIAARGAPRSRTATGPEWAMIAGLVLIAFAWVYPDFAGSESALSRLYAAPFGLVPSPTLALVIGFALLAGGFGARVWTMILGVAGVLLGLCAVLMFGVFSDLILVGGAVSLILTAVVRTRHAGAAIAPI